MKDILLGVISMAFISFQHINVKPTVDYITKQRKTLRA